MNSIGSVIALIIFICLSGSGIALATDNETTAKFSIESMTCATCPISVRKAMERVDGVRDVEVDFESKVATVIFDANVTSTSVIGNASTDVGFPATELVEK